MASQSLALGIDLLGMFARFDSTIAAREFKSIGKPQNPGATFFDVHTRETALLVAGDVAVTQ